MLQIGQWASVGREGRERIVGLNLNVAEASKSLLREGFASLLEGRMQLTLTRADEDDFYGLQRLFYFLEAAVDWRVHITFIQTYEGTSCFIRPDLGFKSIL